VSVVCRGIPGQRKPDARDWGNGAIGKEEASFAKAESISQELDLGSIYVTQFILAWLLDGRAFSSMITDTEQTCSDADTA